MRNTQISANVIMELDSLPITHSQEVKEMHICSQILHLPGMQKKKKKVGKQGLSLHACKNKQKASL